MPFMIRSGVALLSLLMLAPLVRSQDDSVIQPIKDLAELSKTGKLFDKESYKLVRGLCTKVFEERFKDDIKKAFGEEGASLATWFEKNPGIKEEFFTAIDEKADKVDKALTLFRDLWKKSPENMAKYYNLAIAISVVWDDPRGVYDYIPIRSVPIVSFRDPMRR